MRNGNPGKQRQGLVVIDAAVFFQYPAVAMGGVFAQANIGDHGQFRNCGPDLGDGPLHRLVGVPRGRTDIVLCRWQSK